MRGPSGAGSAAANAGHAAASVAGSSGPIRAKEERERAVLDLLAGGSSATDLPLVDREPGQDWNPWLRDKLAPVVSMVPRLRFGPIDVTGETSVDLVRRELRTSYGVFRMCYEAGLSRVPDLDGTLSVTFAVGTNGAVRDVTAAPATTLSDPATVRCILKRIAETKIPNSERGASRISASIEFSPPGSEIEKASDRNP